jgi:hypothetical protein
MGLHLHSWFSAFASALIVFSCAALGAAMGALFPLRTTIPAVSRFAIHGDLKTAPSSSVGNSASPALPEAEAPKAIFEPEAVSKPTPASARSSRLVGRSAPIETDNPCRWSQSADGTLTCTGRQVMIPGAGDALHIRRCVMVFHEKVRFSGIEMHVASKQPKGNPFLVRSPEDWKMNFDAPHATAVSAIFTADTPEPGNVVCQFSYRLQRVP